MTLMIFSSISFSLLFLMPLMIQPLSLGLCIMLLTFIFSIILSAIHSSWYGYILFLVFVGGLLVMFAYVSVLVPNTLFSSFKAILWTSLIFMLSNLILFHSIISIPQHLTPPTQYTSLLKTNLSAGMEIIYSNSTSIIISLGAILLFALLAVVKICYYQQSSLRPYSNLNKYV